MALTTLGSMVTDARGSVGGVVYSRNKGGSYTRARVAPINRNTTAQTQVRNNFAANSKLWSGSLTASERAAWTAFAQANPLINILGASIIVSGMAMFMKLTQVLSQIGAAYEATPPPDLSVPALAATTGITVDGLASTMKINTAAQAVVANAKYYIFASRPMSPGSTPQQSDFRFIAAVAPVAAAVVIDISAEYLALFGFINSGNMFGVAVGTVNTESGAVTPAIIYNQVAS